MKHQYVMGVLRSFLSVIGLPETGRFFLPISDADYKQALVDNGPDHIVWMQREAAEQNTDVLQLLPYLVIRDRMGRIFTYQRAKGIGENRLLGKKSIGVGGHIDLCGHVCDLVTLAKDSKDVESYTIDVIAQTLTTELEEELSGVEAICGAAIRPIGFLLDDVQMDADTKSKKISVGRVHLGLVFEVVVPNVEALRIKEKELIQCDPTHIYSGDTDYSGFENWSAMLLAFYRVQRMAGRISSADTVAWDTDVLHNRGKFYKYTSSPFAENLNLSCADIRWDLIEFNEAEDAVKELEQPTAKKSGILPHSPLDQTPYLR